MRGQFPAAIGWEMTTLQQDNNRPARKRAVALWLVPLAAIGFGTAALLPPLWSGATPSAVEMPLPALTQENAGDLCRALEEDPRDYVSDAGLRRRWELRRQSCNLAFATHPGDLYFKVQAARWMPQEQSTEAIRLWREAAAQGSADAYFQIYEQHRAWDRGHLDRPQLVTRAEAADALRKAAELGNVAAMQVLVRRLMDGGIVKRNPVAARYWAERAAADGVNISLTLGSLLAASDRADERARGLAILERLARGPYVFGATRELANAIRKDDPARARALLEEARRADPGGTVVPLAQMLIAGEGGPADPKRAVSLLQGSSDSWMAKGMLGRLMIEGKWMPQDIQQGVRLIDIASAYDYDARIQVLKLLAEHPEVRLEDPQHLLFTAQEAAELDEPGAMQALIALKLSANAQFQDRPGACKLLETATRRGDQTLARRLADCRG